MEWRRWIYAIPARLKAVFRTRRVEEDLDDELAFHVAMQTRANEQEGLTEREAYRRARVEIGGVEQIKERSRDVRPLRWARDAMQDVRYGLRGLRKTPRTLSVPVPASTWLSTKSISPWCGNPRSAASPSSHGDASATAV